VRKYEYNIGRFTSTDPLFEKYAGWTPYQYSGNNPVNLLDPSGLSLTDPNEFYGPHLIKADGSLDWEGSHFIEVNGKWQYVSMGLEVEADREKGEGMFFHSIGGYINDGHTKTGSLRYRLQAGQHIRIEIKNYNIISAQLDLQDKSLYTYEKNFFGIKKIVYLGDKYSFLLLPFQTRKFNFYKFNYVPMHWEFEISTSISNAVNINISFFSDWVPGMPWDYNHPYKKYK
jgi:hypothetical protein